MSYRAIASQTLTSTQNTVTFANIPQTFRDLVIVVDAIQSSASAIGVAINGDTSNSFTIVSAVGSGSSTASFAGTLNTFATNYGLSASTRQIFNFNIMDYPTTDKHKTVLWRWNASDVGTIMAAGRWANTNAVTEVSVGSSGFSAGSTFALYGVNA